jgi:hypothetical protein
MNYQQRDAIVAASLVRLDEVLSAGEALGYWKATQRRQPDEGNTWRFGDVVTPDGLTFTLSGGSWGREGQITCSVALINGPHGLRSSPTDVLRYQQAKPEASCSYTRSAEAIAKDLHRRVIASPEGIEVARLVRERLDKLLEQHAALRRHVAALEAMGYEFRRLGQDETYKAAGWHRGDDPSPRDVEVDYTGRVTFSLCVGVETLPAVRLLMQGRPD